jgi:hypothetical protein
MSSNQELKEGEKWERCIENTIRKTTFSTLVMIPISLLLFRNTKYVITCIR